MSATAGYDAGLANRDRTTAAYQALSTPGASLAAYFGAEDMTVAGSGQSELFYGRARPSRSPDKSRR